MKKTALLLVILILLSLAVGCSSDSPSSNPPPTYTAGGTNNTATTSAGNTSPEKVVTTFVNAVADKNYDLLVSCIHPSMLNDMLSEYDYEADDEYWTSSESVKINDFQILFVADDTIVDRDQIDLNPSNESDYRDCVFSDDYEEWGISFTQHKSVACSISGYRYYGNGNYREFQSSPVYAVFYTDGRWYIGWTK